MKKKNKIILLSFASNDLKRSIDRLRKQAIESKFYDEIQIVSVKDLDTEFRLKLKQLMSAGKKKGLGYFFWKPWLLKFFFDKINHGDVINYVDVGFHLVKKNSKRFIEYLNLINEDDRWILPFQYHSNFNYMHKGILFPNRDERKYSKGDLLDYFGYYKDSAVTDSPQYMAGCFFIKKTEESFKFLNEWLDVFNKRFDLADDTPSKIKNLNGFLENRHDQSIFSLLCKKYNLSSLSAYECEWAYLNNERTWIHTKDSPLLAKRDLKYNVFRRFLNRQKKTFNRIIKNFNFN